MIFEQKSKAYDLFNKSYAYILYNIFITYIAILYICVSTCLFCTPKRI